MAKKKTSRKKAAKKTTRRGPRFVAIRPIHFPTGDDLQTVIDAGGRRNLTPELLDEIQARESTIAIGRSCDKLPESVFDAAMGAGWIEDRGETSSSAGAEEGGE